MTYEAIATSHGDELSLAQILKDIKTTLARKGNVDDWVMADVLCQRIADFGEVGNNEGYIFADGSTLVETVSPLDLDDEVQSYDLPFEDDELPPPPKHIYIPMDDDDCAKDCDMDCSACGQCNVLSFVEAGDFESALRVHHKAYGLDK